MSLADVRREYLGQPLSQRCRFEHAAVEQHCGGLRRFLLALARFLGEHFFVARKELREMLGHGRIGGVGQADLL